MTEAAVQQNWFRKSCGWTSLGLGFAILICHGFQFEVLAPVTLVPPWLWLVPAILLTTVVWGRGSRFIFVATISIWMIFVALYVEESRSLLRRSRPLVRRTSNQGIRIVTLNCNIGNSHAIREIERWNPDVVMLQESPGRERLNELAHELFGNVAAVLDGGDAAIIIGGELRTKNVDPRRHFVHAVGILADGQAIDLVSLRLSPPVFRLDFWESGFWLDHRETRQAHHRQLQAVRDYLEMHQGTPFLIIGGDFNMVGNDGAFEPFDDLQDTFWQAGAGWCNTGTNEYPLFRVDQIWTTRNVTCTAMAAFKTENSDHRMVVADVTIAGDWESKNGNKDRTK